MFEKPPTPVRCVNLDLSPFPSRQTNPSTTNSPTPVPESVNGYKSGCFVDSMADYILVAHFLIM